MRRPRLASSPSGFQLEAPRSRIVATDYLVSVDTNRYSVPFPLIGRVVEVVRRDEEVRIIHSGAVVATHRRLTGKHEVRIDPAHGPGAVARTARQRHSTPSPVARDGAGAHPEVEIRDLSIYDAFAAGEFMREFGRRCRSAPRATELGPPRHARRLRHFPD